VFPEAPSNGTPGTGADDGSNPGAGGGIVPNGANPANPANPGNSGNEPEGNPPVAGLDGETPAESEGGGTGSEPGAVEPSDCVVPAALAVPVGYGAATTGGGASDAVVVNSFAEAEAALSAYRDAFDEGTASALVLRYTGSFDFTTITDVCAQHEKDAQTLEIKEMENVTFEGAPGSSANFGIHINRAKNVIVRNMTMGLLPGGGDSDAITIEGNETNGDVENVWIDHNELFSSTKDDCDGAGDTEFDGLIDIKKGARRITISYNFLHDHQKTGLIGHSDDDDTERYVTFHHNRYENVVSRTPLHRFGFVHLFNNYYGNISSSGINVRMGGVALIEANFFENAVNPITSRFSEEVGFWDLRNNHVGEGITWSTEEDTLANADTWESTISFPANELSYAYTPDSAGCVKQIVLATAGAKL
jgi:pectate lyase